MRFRAQLALGYMALLFVTFATGATAMVALHETSARLETAGDRVSSDLLEIEQLRLQAEETVAANRGDLLAGGAVEATRFSQDAAAFEARLGRLGPLGERGDVATAARAYLVAARRAEQLRASTGDPRQILPFYVQTVLPAQHQLELALAGLVRHDRGVLEHETGRARSYADRTQGLVALATVLAGAIGLGLAALSARKLASQYAREQEANAAARRAIAARDELVAVVSHDLRNPLTTIVLGANLISASDVDPTLRKHVTAIGDAGNVMQALIDELLDVAKLESGHVELAARPCRVADLFGTIASLFQARAAGANVELAIEPAGDLEIRADRARIVQVLQNLVGNAFKYTPSGGRIALAARRDGERVRFEVSDTGPGVAPEQRAHLFDRYWQGRPRGRGSLGLGLYICKRLVEAHDGEIGLTSEPGHGSTFWFTLPAGSPAARS